MIDLKGKTALVTGGSRGIGRACCELLSQAGAKVAVNYRVERSGAESLAESLRGRGGEAIAVGADVSIRAEAEAAVAETLNRLGGLDILVNNAGIWNTASIDEMTDEQWDQMLRVNQTGTFNTIRAVVPHMKRAQSGKIINISSTAGQRGEAHHAHYAATKGAVISMTKSLASELASSGILTNCVAPGWVETDMSRDALQGDESHKILSTIPLGRPGSPEEIAGAVLFLASDLSNFVNGEILNVNGGAVLCG